MWVNRPNQKDKGKFRPRARLGMAEEQKTQYRGFRFAITKFASSSGLARDKYHVAIFDDLGCRRAYLPGHRSLSFAQAAARDWIDSLLESGKA